MVGPPGSGKSMLSKRIPTISMPAMSLGGSDRHHQNFHSIAGLLNGNALRLFRFARFGRPITPSAISGLLGGGTFPNPGEVSIAHNGVLFLDELPEFKRSTLEVMRQPVEDGRVTVSRAAGSVTFPSEFMLVVAMNPCPCGYFGDLKRECRCSPVQVQRYRQRISGPCSIGSTFTSKCRRWNIGTFRVNRPRRVQAQFADGTGGEATSARAV